jgi:hypothetical protein
MPFFTAAASGRGAAFHGPAISEPIPTPAFPFPL